MCALVSIASAIEQTVAPHTMRVMAIGAFRMPVAQAAKAKQGTRFNKVLAPLGGRIGIVGADVVYLHITLFGIGDWHVFGLGRLAGKQQIRGWFGSVLSRTELPQTIDPVGDKAC